MGTINIDQQLDYIDKVNNINKGKNLKYYILTMGCSLNENDSEKLSGIVTKMGYTKTENIEEANLILFNTCCIRENAEERLFGKLGEAKKYKEKNNAIIAIGGCMMQEKHIVEKLHKSYPYVDIILVDNGRLEDVLDIDGEVIEGLPIKRDDNIKALVTIMNGCNNFCTYCIVPYVRGRERSRHPKDILEEIEGLAKQGYKEIMLLGQNVNSYLRSEKWKEKGLDYNGINSFATLLRAINKIDGIERIRFISPHPKDFTEDVIEAIRDCEKICNFIHLPIQSGSSNILKTMNRKYTKESYLELVNKMREKIPGVKFSTDIIVGFPGETEENFEDTLDVVRKVNFEQVFMFIYSRRVGTPADKMENQIPEEIKHKRFEKLKDLVESQIDLNNKEYIGTTQKVLIEGYSKNDSSKLTGRTESNKVVILDGKNELIGKMLDVKIISEHKWYLKGSLN